jgi:hypothetical protein
VPVQPRVVMDGMIELGVRADDRIVIDEVLLHAPAATLASAAGPRDLLAGDGRGALLFRYDIASTDGFGDVLGGPREWQLSDGELSFGFRPLSMARHEVQELEESTGVALDSLVDRTAIVHGFVLAAAESTGFGRPTDGDPDGNPAKPGGGMQDDGDPDGNPAKPEDDESEGDPDANPADGDPDGNPAKPGGGSGDGDPDGNPAWDEQHRAPQRAQSDTRTPSNTALAPRGPRTTRERVPFLLVVNAPFDLTLPVSTSDVARLEPGEVLPLELHVALHELFSPERVAALEEQAARAQSGVVIEVNDTSAIRLGVQSAGIRPAPEQVRTPGRGGIRVTGR